MTVPSFNCNTGGKKTNFSKKFLINSFIGMHLESFGGLGKIFRKLTETQAEAARDENKRNLITVRIFSGSC